VVTKTKRPVINPGRVSELVHAAVAAAAAVSGRSMSEELAELARQAIEHRKRFADAPTARAFEMATLSFIAGGERKAQESGINQPWASDVECRLEAAVSAAATLFTQFISSEPQVQARAVEALKGRIWFDIVNRSGKKS
jgi:hypothetical protein